MKLFNYGITPAVSVLVAIAALTASLEARAGEHRKAPPSKHKVIKKSGPVKQRVLPVDTTTIEPALPVVCNKGQCREIWTNQVVASGPDGSYLAYRDTLDNRTKTQMLGTHVLFFK